LGLMAMLRQNQKPDYFLVNYFVQKSHLHKKLDYQLLVTILLHDPRIYVH
jgi:hypothetical protein